jgi:hypothetical protein
MKLTGHACAEALIEGNAGGVRVEPRVRAMRVEFA